MPPPPKLPLLNSTPPKGDTESPSDPHLGPTLPTTTTPSTHTDTTDGGTTDAPLDDITHSKLIAITANVPGLWTHRADVLSMIHTHRPHILVLVDVRLHKDQKNS